MGEVTMTTSGLMPKINSLFNSPLYSDVEFVFMDKNEKHEKMYCHKLILALQSRAFAHIFFEDETSPCVIKMLASKKRLFYLLFKFMYTNDVQFHTFDEAQDLCELANDYVVEELVKRCNSYMLQDRLTIENIFTRYEHALKRCSEMPLKDCRNFVCSNVQMVLKSDGFTNASPEVVEDIVKLDNLPLSTELDIIKAVLNWGSESIRRNEIPYNEKNLKKSIDPFLKHLRILSLTSSEFHYLLEHYDIFSSFESMVLTQKILIPDCSVKLPENFCCITSKRNTAILSRNNSDEHQHSVKSSSPKSVRSEPSKSPQPNNKIAFEVRKQPKMNTSISPSQLLPGQQKFNSSPNIADTYSIPRFLLRDFVFDLLKNEKSFKLSFRNDMVCWVEIKMKKGNLSLYGFELKVKKKKELELSVYLQGFSKQSFEKSYKIKMHNDVFSVEFPNQMRLLEGSKGKLDVCIESLSLDQSCQINKTLYEFNSGLNFECEISVGSNRKTDDDADFLFSINKLIYAPF